MLKNFVKGIADAIRRKEGSSELISPMDFAQRIDNLQVGGGTGESNIEYLDVSEVEDTVKRLLFTFSSYVKLTGASGVTIMCTGMAMAEGATYESADFVEIDFSALAFTSEKVEGGSIKDFILWTGINTDSLPRITKEQFYDLTT